MTDAETLTRALGGEWRGQFGNAPCPVCQPERRRDQRALSLRCEGGRLLVFCHKGGCEFRAIVEAAGFPPDALAVDLVAAREDVAKQVAYEAEQLAKARRLWGQSKPINGTKGEAYLRGRGILCDLPPVLRFHPEAWHGPTARRLPALVARVEGGEGFAVHRTYLRADGLGKAEVEPAKAMLGAVTGGAVRLTDGALRLVMGEGIESTLSLACGLLDTPATLWAALSTSGLRGLRLPARPGRLTIACDGDGPGREAAHALAERAHALGWQVGILDPGTGADFNDILTGKVVAA